MSIFFLGTCRVHEPAAILRSRGFDAKTTPHRLHSLKQVLQFIKETVSGERVFSVETIEFASQYASQMVAAGDGEQVLSQLRGPLAGSLRAAKKIAIEISSLREYPSTQVNGPTLYLDKLSAPKDACVEHLTMGETLKVMREIKRRITQPLIWIPHITPPQSQGLEVVIAARKNLSNAIRSGADTLGDEFFDPASVASQIGAIEFFKNKGTDTEHLTVVGINALADHYQHFMR